MIDVLKMANEGLDRIVDERDDAIARADAAEAEAERLRQKVATLRHALQFVMNATGNRFSITSINVATAALDATAN